MAAMSPQRALVVALAALLAGRAAAQISTSAVPIFHGTLDVNQPAGGTLDRKTGQVKLRVNRWMFMPVAGSNGIFPSQEPVLVALGEDSFRLEPGSLVALHGGRVFAYRAPKSVKRGVRKIRIWPQPDGTYRLRFTLIGADLSRLNIQDPVCVPLAVIVGDDDGFSGVTVTSPSFRSRRIAIPGPCNAGGDWPWIQN
jgi:hypothetical protein